MSPAKLYTKEELVMMETYITDFHTSLYIPKIKKLEFHLPPVSILWTNNSVNTLNETSTQLRANQYVLCHRDNAEIVVTSFSRGIYFEY